MTHSQPTDEVEIFSAEECPQGSETWHELHKGIVSAGVMSSVLAEGGGKMRAKLLSAIAGEILSGMTRWEYGYHYTNPDMERGTAMEALAIEHHEFTTGDTVERVGFIRRTVKRPLGKDFIIGASPDGMLPNNGFLEVKTMRPDLLAELIANPRFPTEHSAQVHATMWAGGFDYGLVKIFWPKMNSPMFRVERDEAFISRMADAVETFYHDLDKILSRLGRASA